MRIEPNWLEWLNAVTGGFLHGFGVILALFAGYGCLKLAARLSKEWDSDAQ